MSGQVRFEAREEMEEFIYCESLHYLERTAPSLYQTYSLIGEYLRAIPPHGESGLQTGIAIEFFAVDRARL